MRLGLGISIGSVSGGVPAFDPTTLNPTLWNRASFSGGDWGGEGSLPDLISAATDPGVGTAVNGYTPSTHGGIGSQQIWYTLTSNSVFWNNGAASIVVLCKPASAPANDATTVNLPGIVGVDGAAGILQMAYSSTGLRVSSYDGSYHEVTKAASVSNWHMFAATLDGSNVKTRVDSGTLSGTASGGGTVGAQNILIASNYLGVSHEFDGEILEVLLFDTALVDADLDNMIAYFNDRYALSL